MFPLPSLSWFAKALSTLIRFKRKRSCFAPFSKRFASTLIVFVSFSPVHTTTPYPFWKRFYILSAHAHFNLSAREIGAKLKPRGSVCPPFWILTVEWFWWRHRFQIASFSPSTLQNSVFKKHRFQIAPLWRAFSNGSVFSDRFRRCSVDDSRIRSKTAPFSFENGLVWTRPKTPNIVFLEAGLIFMQSRLERFVETQMFRTTLGTHRCVDSKRWSGIQLRIDKCHGHFLFTTGVLGPVHTNPFCICNRMGPRAIKN